MKTLRMELKHEARDAAPVLSDPVVVRLGRSMMVFDEDEDATGLAASSPLSHFPAARHEMLPGRRRVAAFAGPKVHPPPGVIRKVMAEVAAGHYDAILAYDHLRHLAAGSQEFNETYLRVYLERYATTPQVTPVEFLPWPHGQSCADNVARPTFRWEVLGLTDLLDLAGLWVLLLGLAQLAVAVDVATFLGLWVVIPWPLMAAAMFLGFLGADWLIYQRLAGRVIWDWLMPAWWLLLATAAPAALVHLVKCVWIPISI